MENILAPSILSADFKILGEQIEQTEKAGAKYIHFDVMDGIFVPSISFGMPVLSALKGAVKQALDVHLMVTEPIRYVKEFAKCGADIITVHLEACEDVKATVDEIKASAILNLRKKYQTGSLNVKQVNLFPLFQLPLHKCGLINRVKSMK